ncbi:hypothetical protein L5M18_13010 [Shewanella sp. SM20]|uniref:hypothetical protein n=1 Tax=Shewanella sp. SM20 TaxID=2912792 RepID=UPI0021D82DA0|nr:hypothetical protein [Shewanella sp. SM20]MCU8092477.1 hypothetical protein [Shewanella sp. SM20]
MDNRVELINKLSGHEHFQKYPRLTPWVGSWYSENKILIIGESHYLPKGATYHHDVEKWYAGNELALEEHIKHHCLNEKNGISYISTSGILKARSTDISPEERKSFKAKGHTIYRNLLTTINSSPKFKHQNYLDVIDQVAYYNYFQRPAEETGGSIDVKPRDIPMAESTLKLVLNTLQPELIIVASRKAGKLIKPLIPNYEFVITAHPSSVWWNRQTKKGNCGKSDLTQFLAKHV